MIILQEDYRPLMPRPCSVFPIPMAIYHCQVKTISRAKGRSATAAAAYRTATRIKDDRTGEIHDYRRRTGVIETALFLPTTAPVWAQNREQLWNQAELAERRKNSTVAREVIIALPHELNAKEQKKLTADFARWLSDKYGVAVDMAIHAPDKEGNKKNHHAHLLMSTRHLEKEGFTKKTRELDGGPRGKNEINIIRKNWETHANYALEQTGKKERIDCRSLEGQGVDRQPTKHFGPAATQMERKGRKTRIGNQNCQIKNWNREHYETQWQLQVVNAAIEAEKARLKKEQTTGKQGRTGRAINGRQQFEKAGADHSATRINARLAALQSRHIEEKTVLDRAQDQRRLSHENELAQYYNAAPYRSELRDLQSRKTLSRDDRERMEELRFTIKNSEARTQEQRDILQKNFQQEKDALFEKQARARDALERKIAGQSRQPPDKTRAAQKSQNRRNANDNERQAGSLEPDLANVQRAKMQSRHLEEKTTFDRTQEARRLKLEEELKQYYNVKPYKEDMRDLKAKKRLSSDDREQMENLRLTIANSETRVQEQREGLQVVLQQQQAELFAKQAGERETLERKISGLTEKMPQETGRALQPKGQPEQGRQRDISLKL